MRSRRPLPLLLRLGVLLLAASSLLPASAPRAVAARELLQLPGGAVGRGVVDETVPRVPGQVVVKFRASVTRAQADALKAASQLRDAAVIPQMGAQLLETAPGTELDAIRRLQANTLVEFAEPNYRVRALGPRPEVLAALPPAGANQTCIPIDGVGCPTPVRTATPRPSPTPTPPPPPLDPLYASSQPDLPLINMPAAWARTVGSPTVIAAVIDTGIAFGHPDLDSRIVSLTGPGLPGSDHVFIRSPSSGCSVPATPDDDAWGAPGRFTHGTHVAGTLGAESTIAGDPVEGIAGIAPRALLAPLKVLDCEGSGTGFDVAAAVTFAASRGAAVINMSLGSDGNASSCPFLYQSAMNIAHAAGLVIFAASGNDGTSNRSIPANCQHVIGVGATTNSDVRASFSQFNDTVDISAPGVATMSAHRDNAGVYGYRTLNGTSMATPHVAGCAALMLSVRPGLTPDQVEFILRSTAVDLGVPGRDDQYGSGRLDCGAAVATAAATTPGTIVIPSVTPTSVPQGCGSFASAAPPALGGPLAAKRAPPVGPAPAIDAGPPASRLRQQHSVPYTGAPQLGGGAAPAWTTLLCESFEGPWPTGLWDTYDGNGPVGGEVCWGTDDFQPYGGTGRSAWPAKGCANGVDPSIYLYGFNYDSWMVVGPFDLTGASQAEVRFRLWHQIIGQVVGEQVVGDYLFWGASVNGADFSGVTVTGNSGPTEPPTTQGWLEVALDLGAVPALGSLLGQPRVWIGWRFVSDSAGLDDGPFVDDVVVRRASAPAGPPGGRDFALQLTGPETVRATWVDGSGETGYLGLRWSPSGGTTTVPSSGAALSANATSFVDPGPLPDGVYCYLVAALGGSPPSLGDVRALSDFLCALPRTGDGAGAGSFQVQLRQSHTTTLSWSAAFLPTGYVLTILKFDGSAPQTVALGPLATDTTHDTGGQPTCYSLQAVSGPTVLGTTPTLCVVPGVSTHPGAARAPVEPRLPDPRPERPGAERLLPR